MLVSACWVDIDLALMFGSCGYSTELLPAYRPYLVILKKRNSFVSHRSAAT